MTTDTEALRAQFERHMNLRGWSEASIRRDGLDYSSTQITEAWHAYQAGHAAATQQASEPLTSQQVWENHEIMSVNLMLMEDLMRIVRAVEAAHAIRAGAKETGNG